MGIKWMVFLSARDGGKRRVSSPFIYFFFVSSFHVYRYRRHTPGMVLSIPSTTSSQLSGTTQKRGREYHVLRELLLRPLFNWQNGHSFSSSTSLHCCCGRRDPEGYISGWLWHASSHFSDQQPLRFFSSSREMMDDISIMRSHHPHLDGIVGANNNNNRNDKPRRTGRLILCHSIEL